MSDAGKAGSRVGPIVDAHFHLWNLRENRYPWLQDDPPIPFRYGSYAALRDRNFLPDDYRSAWAGWSVARAVAVEAEWDREDSVGETRWIDSIARATGVPDAFVAHARLEAADVDEMLRQHAEFPIVRGIRQKPALESRVPGGSLMSNRRWRDGYELLSGHGFHYELQAPFPFLDEAVELAEAYPDTPIVLNHAGLPSDRSPTGLEGWRSCMRRFASVPLASVKISGLGGSDGSWDCASNQRIVRDLVGIFGTDRCMFASNYPVDSLCVGFAEMYTCYETAVADLTDEERRKLFHDNAVRIYRLDAQPVDENRTVPQY